MLTTAPTVCKMGAWYAALVWYVPDSLRCPGPPVAARFGRPFVPTGPNQSGRRFTAAVRFLLLPPPASGTRCLRGPAHRAVAEVRHGRRAYLGCREPLPRLFPGPCPSRTLGIMANSQIRQVFAAMVQFLIVRPGSTDFDEQGRIKGTLDIPLSEVGTLQVSRIVAELHDTPIAQLDSSPCRSAEQTAQALAADHKLKVKTLGELQNLDHGLWHGKLIDEVKHSQPKVFRQFQDHPETVCPPQGEPISNALERVRATITRLTRKHKTG